MNPTMKPSLEPQDVSSILNRDVINGHTIVLVALTALAIVFDGADMQLLSVAIPSLMREWDLPRSSFATVMAAGLIGMIIGGTRGCGWRPSRSQDSLAVERCDLWFDDDGDVGGEQRHAVVDSAVRCGNWIGGHLAERRCTGGRVRTESPKRNGRDDDDCVRPDRRNDRWLPGVPRSARMGWRWIFVLGGAVPLSCLVLQRWVLAESPRFLSRRPDRWPELVALLNRMGHAVPADCSFTDDSDRHASHASFRRLFSVEFARDTISLWIALFSCMLAVYAGFNWIPALLSGVGWSDADASRGILYFNFGGVIGACWPERR